MKTFEIKVSRPYYNPWSNIHCEGDSRIFIVKDENIVKAQVRLMNHIDNMVSISGICIRCAKEVMYE